MQRVRRAVKMNKCSKPVVMFIFSHDNFFLLDMKTQEKTLPQLRKTQVRPGIKRRVEKTGRINSTKTATSNPDPPELRRKNYLTLNSDLPKLRKTKPPTQPPT